MLGCTKREGLGQRKRRDTGLAKKQRETKRFKRTVPLSEAVSRAIGPVFTKRGFANRDLITHWGAIAPTPYDKVSIPDKLHWPRGAGGAEGAILFLRCTEGQRLALAHEAPHIAASVNRYFGYVLVNTVKLSPMPFTPSSDNSVQTPPEPEPKVSRQIEAAVAEVGDPGIREALCRLGRGILTQK